MTHVQKTVYGLVCVGTLIAALISHRRTLSDHNDCTHNWCGERNAVFYDISQHVSTRNIHFKAAATASHVINFGILLVGVPLGLSGMLYAEVNESERRAGRTFFVYITSCSFVYAITLLIKSTIPRQRPAAFFNMTNVTELGSKDPADEFESFFSGDSSLSAHAATFFFLFSSKLKPCWRWTSVVFFQCLAATGIILRVVALMHWPSDVLTGAAVGSFIAGISYACFQFDAGGSTTNKYMQFLISVGADKTAGVM